MSVLLAFLLAAACASAAAYPDKPVQYMPAFLAEKSKAYIEDARAAGLLK